MSTSTDKATSSATERFTGRVKWFNNKAGYGFITITDGSRAGSDIFVHHSVIGVSNQQFRYLVQGEYVEFSLVPTTQNTSHDIQAADVCGIKGGKLMCETRNEYKAARTNLTETNFDPVKMPRQKSVEASKPFVRKTSNATANTTAKPISSKPESTSEWTKVARRTGSKPSKA